MLVRWLKGKGGGGGGGGGRTTVAGACISCTARVQNIFCRNCERHSQPQRTPTTAHRKPVSKTVRY